MTRRTAAFGLAGLAAANTRKQKGANVTSRIFSFAGGGAGEWKIVALRAVIGDSLPAAERLSAANQSLPASARHAWVLRGVTSNARYITAAEKQQLIERQAAIGRPEATRAALIPIRKSAAWWDLPQDERRRIFEETSHHTRIGLKYLPGIARRLHHCRDLGNAEPFDFLTWFDYAPSHAQAFEDLVGELRATEEWKYVDREVDIRLTR